MSLERFESIAAQLQRMGYAVRQSPSSGHCWYLSKLEFHYLFSLVWENEAWKVLDISGRGVHEQPRVEQAIREACQ